jgi:hypothetical protein
MKIMKNHFRHTTVTFMAFMASCAQVVIVAQQAPAPVQIQNGGGDAHGRGDRSRDRRRLRRRVDRSGLSLADADDCRRPEMCGWYSDRQGTVRGSFIDDDLRSSSFESRVCPKSHHPPAPCRSKRARTGVLARAVGGKVERLRTLSDDCPMDAGGRAVCWISSVTPAESLRFLNSLTRPVATDRAMFDNERQIVSSAIRAIGYHADASADGCSTRWRLTMRTRASASGGDHARRLSRRAWRGDAHAPDRIRQDSDERRSLVTALGQSRESATVETFRSLTRDPDARIRSEAAYFVCAAAAVVSDALKLASSDPEDSVRKRVVSGIARLPNGAGIPSLIDLARTPEMTSSARPPWRTQPVQTPRHRAHGRDLEETNNSTNN